MKAVLSLGGMKAKGFVLSSKDLLVELSSEGKAIAVLGYEWDTKNDLFSLEEKTINKVNPSHGGVEVTYRDAHAAPFHLNSLFRDGRGGGD